MFDTYLLKINKEEDLFKNLYSHYSSNWPEEPNELLHITVLFLFRAAHAIPFHTCYDCLMKRVEIVASINDLTVGLTFAMGCKYRSNITLDIKNQLILKRIVNSPT